MPDVDNTLRKIAQWKYIATTDMSNAFYQIPLSQESMKYCGVVTPFRGVRVYARSAMGMPGSEKKKASSPNWQTTYIVEETPSPNSSRA